ncbi:hypothetical protein LEP1GSC110_3749 [Leptospira interrogans serovar Medanensis str. UT053]|nr:hypothetical protein LEP1GSC110_3749 [Leptospira interrogans serovar Medanensis str. UT053]
MLSFPTRFIKSVEFSNAIHKERCVEFFLFLGGAENFSLSEKHTFCK